MIAFILLVAALIVGVAAWLIANGSNERKRARMSVGAGMPSRGIVGGASFD